MKKSLVLIIVFAILLLGSFYWFYNQAGAELAAKKSINVEEDDFILHIHAENGEEGFQVYRSLQYVGEEQVEISHQTPLISVSFKNKNHDYTGSHVSETLNSGESYHPQDPEYFNYPEKGEYDLHCETKFTVNGKKMKISLKEKLTFQ